MSTFAPQPKVFKAKRAPLRVNPVSRRRQSKADLRRAVREYVLARDLICQVHERHLNGGVHVGDLPKCDYSLGLDVHELIRRSAWRDGIYHPNNCITVCRAHHDWIGANPERATALGLSLPSWTPHCTPTNCACDFKAGS